MPTSPRPGLRWSVPIGVTALVVGGAVLGPVMSASAEVELPARTPAQLLTDLQTAQVEAFSGTVSQRAELGLPALPEGMGSDTGTDVLSLLTGDHELRVWADGERARVALHGRRIAESDVITDGSQVWLWSSEERTATRLVLPEGAAADRAGRAEALAEALPPVTPEQVTAYVLSRLERSTDVSAGQNTLVAGRPAYELVLAPGAGAEDSLVGTIRIAVDAEERVATRVQVFADGATAPALEVGFTTLSFDAPDPSVFRFSPPEGATVEEHVVEGHDGHDAMLDGHAPHGLGDAGPDDDAADEGPDRGAVVGTGWDAVAVGRVPDEVGAVDGELGAFLQALPRVEGEWGSGRLLTSALFTALLTDDGRLLVGAVTRDALLEAALDPAAAVG